jgi:hypothetical protein
VHGLLRYLILRYIARTSGAGGVLWANLIFS